MTMINGVNLTRDFSEHKYKFYTDLDIIVKGQSAVNFEYYNAVCVKECPVIKATSEAEMPSTLPLKNMQTTKYAQDYVFDPVGNFDLNEALKIQLSDTKNTAG